MTDDDRILFGPATMSAGGTGPVNISRALGLSIWGHPIPQHAWEPLDRWAAELVQHWPTITVADVARHCPPEPASLQELCRILLTHHRTTSRVDTTAELRDARDAIATARGACRLRR